MKKCPLLSCSLISLSKGKYAIVDIDDYESLSQYKWHANKARHGYRAMRRNKKLDPITYMHRQIMGLKHGNKLQVDHINHNALDNRRLNLRICTNQQNCMNQNPQKRKTSSRYKGVFWNSQKQKWQAKIKINGKSKHLGFFCDENEAAKSYNAEAKVIFGEFSRLNLIVKDETEQE